MRLPLLLGTIAGLSLFASTALADDAPVTRPADVHTDPKTGAQMVTVPQGCTGVTQSTGQILIVCPYAAPKEGEAPAAPAPPPKYEANDPQLKKKWYGWQILIVDGAALTLGVAIAGAAEHRDGAEAGAWIWLSGYALGGPIVHWSNGQVGKGFASLGLRVGAPIVAGVTGAVIGGSDSDSSSAVAGAALGIIAGGIAAVVIDTAVLARKTVVERPARASGKIQWSPTAGYDPRRQSFSAGVGGTF